MAKAKTMNRWKVALDVVITLGFLFLMEPKATGLSLHEWGGLGIALFFIVHKAFNWSWIKGVTRNFFRKGIKAATRLNYVVDLCLLVGFGLILFSGMAIAKTIDFTWLLGHLEGGLWRGLHLVASLFILVGVGIHLGLHWDWIKARMTRKSSTPEMPATATEEVAHA